MSISGVVDDTKLALVLLVFAVFAMTVLSFQIGVALVVYAFIYLWAISRKPVWGYQFSKNPTTLLALLGIPAAIFLGYVFINDIIIGSLGFGSSLQLYSTSLQAIVTIDTPIVRFFIWGVLIPILETMFFVGVIGFFLAKQLGVESKLITNKLDTWVVVGLVGLIAAVFHIVSQLTAPELLIMDVILFGICMTMTLKFQDLKQAAIFHIIINSVVMIFIRGVFAGGVF